MFDLNKRSYFTTLGELRLLLADYPDDTSIYACGASGCYLHIDDEGKLASIDYDALDFEYEDWCHAEGEAFYDFLEGQHVLIEIEHEARLAELADKKGE